jgi:hypothetical protein
LGDFGRFHINSRSNFSALRANSLFFAEQGIFSRRTGNFSTEQGIFSRTGNTPIGFMETSG